MAADAAAAAAGEAAAAAVPNHPVWTEAVSLVIFALVAGLLLECMNWYFIYRKEGYVRLKESMKRVGRMWEKRKRELKAEGPRQGEAGKKKGDKKLEQLEKDLRLRAKDMTMLSMKSTMLLSLVTMGIFFSLNKRYHGHVIAKLPFEPWKIVRNVSHRGLPGEDPTDCSVTFLMIMANMAIRGSLSKLFGNEQLRVMNQLNNPLAGEEE